MGQVCITETSLIHEEWGPDERNNDWSLDEWNDEGSCVGWHEDYERMCFTTANSFPFESSESVTADRDTRSTGNAIFVKFDRERVGDGSSYYWISGVEACQFQEYDEKCQTRSLNGRLAGAHQVLGSKASAFAATRAASDVHKVGCNAAETVSKEQQDFHVESDGGYMIRIHSKKLSGDKTSFWEIFERAWNDCSFSSLSWNGCSRFPFEPRSEVWRNPQLERRRADVEQCLEKENQQSGNEYNRAVSSLVQGQLWTKKQYPLVMTSSQWGNFV